MTQLYVPLSTENKLSLTFQQYLQNIIETSQNELERRVARDLAHVCKEPESFLETLINQEVKGAIIHSLNHPYQAHQFYDTFFCEIETILEEYEKELADVLSKNADPKSEYVVFAYEKTARSIYGNWQQST